MGQTLIVSPGNYGDDELHGQLRAQAKMPAVLGKPRTAAGRRVARESPRDELTDTTPCLVS